MSMRARVLLLAAAAAVSLAGAAAQAHPPPRTAERELVRVQGYRTAGPVAGAGRQLVLKALGSEHQFAATDWQVFGFAEEDKRATPTPVRAQERYALQGSRDVLRRLATARPDQLVTILAERRPGSTELFVLALDLCPR